MPLVRPPRLAITGCRITPRCPPTQTPLALTRFVKRHSPTSERREAVRIVSGWLHETEVNANRWYTKVGSIRSRASTRIPSIMAWSTVLVSKHSRSSISPARRGRSAPQLTARDTSSLRRIRRQVPPDGAEQELAPPTRLQPFPVHRRRCVWRSISTAKLSRLHIRPWVQTLGMPRQSTPVLARAPFATASAVGLRSVNWTQSPAHQQPSVSRETGTGTSSLRPTRQETPATGASPTWIPIRTED